MGITVDTYPPIIRAEEKVEKVEVPGMDGELTLDTGRRAYKNYEKYCPCTISANADVQAVIDWLKGSGTIVFGNEPQFAYEVSLENELLIEKIIRERDDRKFTLVLNTKPKKKLATPESDLIFTANGTITNPGNVDALPLIKVEGSGNIGLMIGQFVLDIKGLVSGTPILIDCEAGMATDTLKTINMTAMLEAPEWEFPAIKPGNNALSFTGSATKITITPRWRWV